MLAVVSLDGNSKEKTVTYTFFSRFLSGVVDSSFHKKSMKLDKYVKINEWFDSSLGQSTVIQ